MKSVSLPLGLLLAASAVPAYAQAAAPAQVNVTIGKSLEALSSRFGPRELDYLRQSLSKQIAKAAGQGGFTRVELVLQDATPNRPTPAMRSKIDAIDISSTSLGGATITGVAYGPNGEQPLKSSWYETNYSSEVASGVWYDAERAFTFLAGDLKRGRVPQKFGPNTPPHLNDDVLNPTDPMNFPK